MFSKNIQELLKEWQYDWILNNHKRAVEDGEFYVSKPDYEYESCCNMVCLECNQSYCLWCDKRTECKKL